MVFFKWLKGPKLFSPLGTVLLFQVLVFCLCWYLHYYDMDITKDDGRRGGSGISSLLPWRWLFGWQLPAQKWNRTGECALSLITSLWIPGVEVRTLPTHQICNLKIPKNVTRVYVLNQSQNGRLLYLPISEKSTKLFRHDDENEVIGKNISLLLCFIGNNAFLLSGILTRWQAMTEGGSDRGHIGSTEF